MSADTGQLVRDLLQRARFDWEHGWSAAVIDSVGRAEALQGKPHWFLRYSDTACCGRNWFVQGTRFVTRNWPTSGQAIAEACRFTGVQPA